jgi:hypothetical protein
MLMILTNLTTSKAVSVPLLNFDAGDLRAFPEIAEVHPKKDCLLRPDRPEDACGVA